MEDNTLLPTVGDPTAIALDLKTSVMMSFLLVLLILKILTRVSGDCFAISSAILWANFLVPSHIVSYTIVI